MQEHAQSITPESPDLPHVGWREVVTLEHLPRLLVLCLAIRLHAANTLLAATTMPEVVGDIGGLRLISWAFALYLMGSIVAATAVSACVASAGLRRTMLVSRPWSTPSDARYAPLRRRCRCCSQVARCRGSVAVRS